MLCCRFRLRIRFCRGLITFDNHMCISTAHAKGTDPRHLLLRIGPSRGVLEDLNRSGVPRNVWVRGFEMKLPGNQVMLQRHEHLNQASHASSSFEMTDIGFHRTNQQWIFFGTITTISRHCRLDFKGIAELCACAVCFQITDVCRGNSCPLHRLLDDRFLGLGVGCRQATTESIVSNRRPLDHTDDRITICLCIGKTLEGDDATAFSTQVTVGRRVKGS